MTTQCDSTHPTKNEFSHGFPQVVNVWLSAVFFAIFEQKNRGKLFWPTGRVYSEPENKENSVTDIHIHPILVYKIFPKFSSFITSIPSAHAFSTKIVSQYFVLWLVIEKKKIFVAHQFW